MIDRSIYRFKAVPGDQWISTYENINGALMIDSEAPVQVLRGGNWEVLEPHYKFNEFFSSRRVQL